MVSFPAQSVSRHCMGKQKRLDPVACEPRNVLGVKNKNDRYKRLIQGLLSSELLHWKVVSHLTASSRSSGTSPCIRCTRAFVMWTVAGRSMVAHRPKSISTRRLCRSTRRFPGCGSAWKKPRSSSCGWEIFEISSAAFALSGYEWMRTTTT